MTGWRRYRYVGPDDVRRAAATGPGTEIRTAGDLGSWALDEPVTFVVAVDGVLRVTPRRSEHVACAGGGDVLAAGEMAFAVEDGLWSVVDGDFTCAVCGGSLPPAWNFGDS